jgi:uncharacterized protein
VRFEWDALKSELNLARRGFDFEFGTLVFQGAIAEWEDLRRDYGERRFVAVGLADARLLTVVYTDRFIAGAASRRIISARYSNRRERELYAKTHQTTP